MGVSNAPKATTLKDAQETAAENEIARGTAVAEDIPGNVNVSVDGLDVIAPMKKAIFAAAKMNAEEYQEVYA